MLRVFEYPASLLTATVGRITRRYPEYSRRESPQATALLSEEFWDDEEEPASALNAAHTRAQRATMGIRLLRRDWKLTKAIWPLMIAELPGLVAVLALFGIAQPDTFRTVNWSVGYQNGFNSNPAITLYAYANHRPLPNIPLVWSAT